jgi:hypothetical protein
MYSTARQLTDLARPRQRALLSQAAAAGLIRRARRARRSPSVPSPTSRSMRSRLATGRRALAARIDNRAQLEAA